LIERPKRYPTFPDYLYTTTAAKPSFFWKKEDPNNPNGDIFQVVWLNLIKVCRLKLTEDKKYKMDVIKKYLLHYALTFYSIDLENIYICGLTQIKEFYVIC
jgi:hypothetical protein